MADNNAVVPNANAAATNAAASSSKSAPQQQKSGKHPKGFYYLFSIEMWERFGFYGMDTVLVVGFVMLLVAGKLQRAISMTDENAMD